MAQPGKAGPSYLSLAHLPRPLDIVGCRFPLVEEPAKPGPKARPGLVRSIALNADQTRAAIEITYGTTKLKGKDRPFDLHIQNFACIEACGLQRATRFDLDRTIWLPWIAEFFAPMEGYKDIRVGSLDDRAQAQLEALKVARRIHTKR